jgi:hypothetical protein
MFDDDPRWDDPRERDDDPRQIEVHWIELGRGPASNRPEDDPRERDKDIRDRDSDPRDRKRDHDPRDVFLEGLELPRGLEREIIMVLDGDQRYELNGEDGRSLAAAGAFRVVSERDLRDPRDGWPDPREDGLRGLREQGLIRMVSLDGRERAVTLTDRGRHLLHAHGRDCDDGRQQEFYAGINRPRELTLCQGGRPENGPSVNPRHPLMLPIVHGSQHDRQ